MVRMRLVSLDQGFVLCRRLAQYTLTSFVLVATRPSASKVLRFDLSIYQQCLSNEELIILFKRIYITV